MVIFPMTLNIKASQINLDSFIMRQLFYLTGDSSEKIMIDKKWKDLLKIINYKVVKNEFILRKKVFIYIHHTKIYTDVSL